MGSLIFVPFAGGAGASGNVPEVARVEDLTTLALPTFAFVLSVRDFFVRRPDSTLTVDGITVEATHNGVGRWERCNIPSISWAQQTTFVVNPLTGDDQNTGQSNAQALRTFAELIRRFGPDFSPPNDILIQLRADCSENFSLRIRQTGDFKITLQGVLTQHYSGVLTGVTNKDPATDTPTAAVASWDPATELFRLAENQQTGGAGWIIKNNGGGSARLTDMVFDTSPTVTRNNNVGNTIVTYSHTRFTGAATFIVSGQQTGAVGQFPCGLVLQSVHLDGAAKLLAADGGIDLFSCRLGPLVQASGRISLVNCLTAQSAVLADGEARLRFAAGGLHRTNNVGFTIFSGSVISVNNFISQGAGINCQTGGLLQISTGGLGIMDVANEGGLNAALTALRGAQGFVVLGGSTEPVWGTNTASYGVRMSVGSKLKVGTFTQMTIKGASGDVAIDNNRTTALAFDPTTGTYITPARTLSWANLAATVAAGGFGGTMLDPQTGIVLGSGPIA